MDVAEQTVPTWIQEALDVTKPLKPKIPQKRLISTGPDRFVGLTPSEETDQRAGIESSELRHRTSGIRYPIEPGRMTLTVEETAVVLGIGRTAAYAGVRSGTIPSRRIGRRIVVPIAALERMLTD